MSSSFGGVRFLICGGTGSLGEHVVRRLLTTSPELIRVYSRDEKKQFDMRRTLGDLSNLQFFIGDVRDRLRLREALHGIDVAINAAALKHIPVCEEAPTEAILTNVYGAINLRREALALGVKTAVFISTDKAVKPTNVLGMTKALMERVVLVPAPTDTRFLCVRYGNVFGSRGSVVSVFADQIASGKPISITDNAMTRFVLTLDDAVTTIFSALEAGQSGEIWVRQCDAIRILDLGRTMAVALRNDRSYPIESVGIRRGEKIHEILVSPEEVAMTRTDGQYFRISPNYARSSSEESGLDGYSSQNQRVLSEREIIDLLRAGGWISDGSMSLSSKTKCTT